MSLACHPATEAGYCLVQHRLRKLWWQSASGIFRTHHASADALLLLLYAHHPSSALRDRQFGRRGGEVALDVSRRWARGNSCVAVRELDVGPASRVSPYIAQKVWPGHG